MKSHTATGPGTVRMPRIPTLLLLAVLAPALFFCSGTETKPQNNTTVPVFIPKGPAQTRILSDARIHGLTGLSYYREGQYKKAVVEYRTAITKLTLIDNHIEIGRIRLNLALINIRLKQWTEARKNISMARDTFGNKNLPEDRSRCEAIMGQYHESRKEYGDALTAYRKSLAILQAGRGDLREISEQLGNIGFILFSQKKYKDAIAALGQAAGLADRLRFYSHIPEYYTWLGKSYIALGENKRALNYFYNALTADKASENSSGIGHDLHNIGNVLFLMGKYSEASDYLSRAVRLHSALRKTKRVLKDLEILIAIAEKTGDKKRAHELKLYHYKLKRTQR